MTTIEKMARAIWSAQLDHYGKYRGNVDTPFDDLSDARQRELMNEARYAFHAMPKPISELVTKFHWAFEIPSPYTLSEIEPDRKKCDCALT